MAPFVRAVNEYGQPKLKDFKKVAVEDRHNIQTHVDYLSMLVSIVFLLEVILIFFLFNHKSEVVNTSALWVLERRSAATAGEPGPIVSSGCRRPADST